MLANGYSLDTVKALADALPANLNLTGVATVFFKNWQAYLTGMATF